MGISHPTDGTLPGQPEKVFRCLSFRPELNHCSFRTNRTIVSLDGLPDGKYVMFSSERSGSSDAWLIAVDGGKAKGEPVFIKKDWGFLPMGLTHSGDFYYAVNNNVWGVQIAEYNPTGGNIISRPLTAFKRGNIRTPDWSPDGSLLAGVLNNESNQAVIIRSMDTDEEREIRIGERKIEWSGIRWTPDGKAIVVTASEAGKGRELIRIDVQTGQVTSLMPLTV